ncbi:MAG: tRNA (adenosine(37)-N6)-threonylcarbamoyltransferase complex ATPase subunit type 1 TsaE [Candidatus Omnitrophica bacterium]|nr:tRNA (adenosine(37)-N6)-threonylcarbamoyltransferase complex ATPase subunit type 1 TsaE [Candidatus Omnitrophota bacterium]
MQVITNSEKETFDLGRKLAARLKKGDIVALEGELGAGKTIFVKGVAAGLGFDRDKVVSSSFVLIREYKAKLPLHHFDLYRLKNKCEFADLGYEEYFFGDGVCLVEWADKAREFIPPRAIRISFKVAGKDKRKIEYSGL